jgi:hypothetical protein
MIEANPIIDEIHRTREKLLERFNGDLTALMRDMQRRTSESHAAGREVVSLPPRPAVQHPVIAKKAS